MKKWMSLLLALTLCLCTVCGALAENAGGGGYCIQIQDRHQPE